jgi:hypothetical protein
MISCIIQDSVSADEVKVMDLKCYSDSKSTLKADESDLNIKHVRS